MRATRGALSPNFQVATTHARHIVAGIQAFVWTSTKNEWNAQNAISSRAFGPLFGTSITHQLITRVLTFYHERLHQT